MNFLNKSKQATLLSTQLHRYFSYIPEQYPRYFMLKYNLVKDFAYKRVSNEKQHLEKVKELEENGLILFGGSSVNNDSVFFLFNSTSEVEPFNFMKSDPYYLNNLLTSYEIKEIEMPKRSESKEVLTSYKFN